MNQSKLSLGRQFPRLHGALDQTPPHRSARRVRRQPPGSSHPRRRLSPPRHRGSPTPSGALILRRAKGGRKNVEMESITYTILCQPIHTHLLTNPPPHLTPPTHLNPLWQHTLSLQHTNLPTSHSPTPIHLPIQLHSYSPTHPPAYLPTCSGFNISLFLALTTFLFRNTSQNQFLRPPVVRNCFSCQWKLLSGS